VLSGFGGGVGSRGVGGGDGFDLKFRKILLENCFFFRYIYAGKTLACTLRFSTI
jgi:hypothetical protein